jgi:hypothetical protein
VSPHGFVTYSELKASLISLRHPDFNGRVHVSSLSIGKLHIVALIVTVQLVSPLVHEIGEFVDQSEIFVQLSLEGWAKTVVASPSLKIFNIVLTASMASSPLLASPPLLLHPPIAPNDINPNINRNPKHFIK